jgi:hypothetical protein
MAPLLTHPAIPKKYEINRSNPLFELWCGMWFAAAADTGNAPTPYSTTMSGGIIIYDWCITKHFDNGNIIYLKSHQSCLQIKKCSCSFPPLGLRPHVLSHFLKIRLLATYFSNTARYSSPYWQPWSMPDEWILFGNIKHTLGKWTCIRFWDFQCIFLFQCVIIESPAHKFYSCI